LSRVFDLFVQGNTSLDRAQGGLGIGLTLVRGLVELHGGTIEASSAGQNQGATFRVVLPVAAEFVEPPAPERPLHRRVVALGTTTLAGLNGVHVLAVDDDGDALALVREILEAAGAHVTTVGSAQSALDQIARVRPDALIADLGMPGVDGFELIDRIRGSQDTGVRSLPAAALTAYARSEDRTRALRQGFQVHLAKPIDPSELVAAVASLIRQPEIRPSDS
jgi:CheY-like chemotaxis protein